MEFKKASDLTREALENAYNLTTRAVLSRPPYSENAAERALAEFLTQWCEEKPTRFLVEVRHARPGELYLPYVEDGEREALGARPIRAALKTARPVAVIVEEK